MTLTPRLFILPPPPPPPSPNFAIQQVEEESSSSEEELEEEDEVVPLTPEQKARKKQVKKAWKKLKKRMSILNLLRLRRAATPVPSREPSIQAGRKTSKRQILLFNRRLVQTFQEDISQYDD